MMDWLGDHAWEAWLVGSLILAGAELTTLDLTLLMMAVGAGAGCVVAAFGLSVYLQVLVAVVVAIAMLGLVRPNMVRRLHRGPTVTSGSQALIGQSAVVLEEVTANGGRVKLHGEVWSARAAEASMRIVAGDRVEVAEIDGATAVVYPSQP